MKNEFSPEESRFKSLQEFETRKQLPGKSSHVFLLILKKLLNKALPNLDQENLLRHHFLDGLLNNIAQQLRAIPEIKTTQQALARACLLFTVEELSQSALIQMQNSETTECISKVEQMLIQMDEKISSFQLSIRQVAAAQTTPGRTSPSQNSQRPLQCYNCQQFGHSARNCCKPIAATSVEVMAN